MTARELLDSRQRLPPDVEYAFAGWSMLLFRVNCWGLLGDLLIYGGSSALMARRSSMAW
jgi:hypothetical protein